MRPPHIAVILSGAQAGAGGRSAVEGPGAICSRPRTSGVALFAALGALTFAARAEPPPSPDAVLRAPTAPRLEAPQRPGPVPPPEPGVPREVSFATPADQTLPNGLRVITVSRPGLPLLSAHLLISSGAEADPPERAGLASVTASLLTRGTATRTAVQIAEQIEALGGEIEAEATWDRTAVKLNVLSAQAEPALEILADVVRAPTFLAEEIERIRREALDELRVSLEEPRTVALAAAQRAIFGSAPYAHPRTGTLASLPRITRDDVAPFHAVHFRPGNAVLIFVGALTPEQGVAWAGKFFGDWTDPANPHPARAPAGSEEKPRVIVIDMPNAGQAAVVVAKRGIARSSADYLPGLVTNAILGNGYTSRLNAEIRIKRGLSYGAKSGLTALAEPGPFYAFAQTKNSAAVEVAGLIRAELERLARDPVPADELLPRVSTLTGDYTRGLETNAGIAAVLGELAIHRRPLTELATFTRDARAVPAEAIAAFAHGHLASSATTVVIAGRLKDFHAALKSAFPAAEIIAQKDLDLDTAALRGSEPARD